MLTQSEEGGRELLQGETVHRDGTRRLGLHLVTLLQKDRQTLTVFLQRREAEMTEDENV